MDFGSSIKYVLGSIKTLPNILSGTSYLFKGGIQKSFNLFSVNSKSVDISRGSKELSDAFGRHFWISVIFTVLSLIYSCIFMNNLDGMFGSLTEELFATAFTGILSIISVVFSLVSLIIPFFISALLIFGSKKYERNLDSIAYKVGIAVCLAFIVFQIFSVLSTLGTFVFGLIGVIVNFSIGTLLGSLFSLVYGIAQAVCIALNYACMLNGLNQAVAVGTTGTGYNTQNDYNTQSNMNYNNQNTFNNQNSQVDFNKQNNVNQNNNNQNVQMYACPYCGSAIAFNTSPCPHCQNALNWGN